MRDRLWEKSRESKGQSLLEFAMVIPVLCIIFMGIFDFGWILHKQITMDNATRAAARRGAVGIDTPTLEKQIQDAVYFDLAVESIDIAVLNPDHYDIFDSSDRTPDNYIAVKVTLNDVQLVTPLKNLVSTITTINLRSRSEFLIE